VSSLPFMPRPMVLYRPSLCGRAGWWQPEESAGLLSRLFFSYCNGILAMGSRKILVQDDLWDVSRCVCPGNAHVFRTWVPIVWLLRAAPSSRGSCVLCCAAPLVITIAGCRKRRMLACQG